MDIPLFIDGEFVNGTLLNNAASGIAADFELLGYELHSPGLISPGSLTITPSNLVLSITTPSPFAVMFSSGIVATATGTVNGADTDTYSLNLSSFVPGSGSQTVYVLAEWTTTGQNEITVVGAPDGHPDYDALFVPFLFYSTQRDTIQIIGSTTPANNTTTFELCRVSLSEGQSIITQGEIITSYWVYASSVLNPTGIVSGSYSVPTITVSGDGRIVAVSGTAAGGVLSGSYPNPGMAAGAAATNVGSLGGALTGTLPNPGFNYSVIPHGTVAYSASGIFTVPSNVYYVRYRLWAGGGGGGGISSGASGEDGGGGGGGGGYCEDVISVTPGQNITVNIGAGGTAGSSAGGNGGTGGNTSLTGYGTADGGVGGNGTTNGLGTGGAGGSASGASINIAGQHGANAQNVGNSTTGLGGVGGTAFGGGGPSWYSTGIADGGGYPGAGGSGAGGGAGAQVGGVGGGGLAIFQW